MDSTKSRNWTFTWNNYYKINEEHLRSLNETKVSYICFGKEIAPETGTPHLQGYVEFPSPLQRSTVKSRMDHIDGKQSKIHLEPAKKCRQANFKYCSKTGDFYEKDFTVKKPSKQGKRSDWDELLEFIKPGDKTIIEVTETFPSLAIRYQNAIVKLIAEYNNKSRIETLHTQWRYWKPLQWQSDLINEIDNKPYDGTSIIWFVDEGGQKGKTTMTKFLTDMRQAFMGQNGKSSDLGCRYNYEKLAVFNFTRSTEGHLNYTILENFSDGCIDSPKFMSSMKRTTNVRVICFANFMPELKNITLERWDIRIMTGSRENTKVTKLLPWEIHSLAEKQTGKDIAIFH